MTIKEQIEKDLKTAMLAGDKTLATTLRGLKSVILYAEVANGSRESSGLNDDEIIELFSKEVKKRQESADLFVRGGNQEKADAELEERKVIEKYLPQQLNDDELRSIVETVSSEMGGITQQTMGQAIGKVRELTKGSADGAKIAQFVKEKIG